MESNITLWQFLLELLVNERQYKTIISWTNNQGEFKLINAEEVAKLWGLRKNKHNMNYDKLSRALRYYYDKHIIKKVQGQKFVYRFVTNPGFSFAGQPQASPLATANKPPTSPASMHHSQHHAPLSPLLDSQQLAGSHHHHHHHHGHQHHSLSPLYQNAYANVASNPFAQSHHSAFGHQHRSANPFSAHHQLANFHHQNGSAPASENEPTDLSRKTGSCSSVASSSSASPSSGSPPTSPSSCDVNNNTIISDLINSATTSAVAAAAAAAAAAASAGSQNNPDNLTTHSASNSPNSIATSTSSSSPLSSSSTASISNSCSNNSNNNNNNNHMQSTKNSSNNNNNSNVVTGSSPSRAHKNKPKPPPISTSLAAAAAQQSSQHNFTNTINKTLQTPNIQFASPFPRFNSSLNLNSPVHNSPLSANAVSQHRQSSINGASSDNIGAAGGQQHQHQHQNQHQHQQQHQHQHHTPSTPSTPSNAHSLLSNSSLSLWSQFTNPLLSPLMMNHKHQQTSLNGNSNNHSSNAALSKAANNGNNKDSNNNNIKGEINNNNIHNNDCSPFNQSPHAFQFPAPAMAAAAAMSGATGQPLDKCMSTILGSPLLSPLLFGDQASLFSPLKLENPLHL